MSTASLFLSCHTVTEHGGWMKVGGRVGTIWCQKWILKRVHSAVGFGRNKSGFPRSKDRIWCNVKWRHSVSDIRLGQEEDDDARQQHHHHHHRRQEEGSARRPARQSEQGPAHAARLAVSPDRRAGEPHVQGAVHWSQGYQRPLTPPPLTFRWTSGEEDR